MPGSPFFAYFLWRSKESKSSSRIATVNNRAEGTKARAVFRRDGLTELATLLEKTLHEEIPLTREIGVEVVAASPQRIELAAPLSPNINHKCTAFGGSLYAVAVLAGWSMVFARLHAAGLYAHIVIQDAKIEYLLPVIETINARCELASDAEFDRCLKLFSRKGRGRIALDVQIVTQQGVAVRFCGNYVIHS